MGGISIWQLLIIAVIVVLLFGTNKLRTLGSDLGASIKGFKKAIGDDNTPPANTTEKTVTMLTLRLSLSPISSRKRKLKSRRTKSRYKPCLTLGLVNCCWYW